MRECYLTEAILVTEISTQEITMLMKLIVVPAFLLAMIVGIIAGMQYMSGDRAKAIKTAEGGLALATETMKYIFIGIVAMEILFAVLLFVFFAWRS